MIYEGRCVSGPFLILFELPFKAELTDIPEVPFSCWRDGPTECVARRHRNACRKLELKYTVSLHYLYTLARKFLIEHGLCNQPALTDW